MHWPLASIGLYAALRTLPFSLLEGRVEPFFEALLIPNCLPLRPFSSFVQIPRAVAVLLVDQFAHYFSFSFIFHGLQLISVSLPPAPSTAGAVNMAAAHTRYSLRSLDVEVVRNPQLGSASHVFIL